MGSGGGGGGAGVIAHKINSANRAATKQPKAATAAKITDFGICRVVLMFFMLRVDGKKVYAD